MVGRLLPLGSRPRRLGLSGIVEDAPVSLAYYIRTRGPEGEAEQHSMYAGKKLWEVSAKPLGLDRITSYNVCYTKLLRMSDDEMNKLL